MLPLVPFKRSAEAEQDSDDSEIWEEVTHLPNVQDAGASQPTTIDLPPNMVRKGRKRSGITKEQKIERLRLHQVHLVSLLAAAIARNKWCNDDFIQSICYSMISVPVSRSRLFKHSIKEFLNHWKSTIKLDITEDENVMDSSDNLLKSLINRCIDSRNNYNLGFSAACRSMQLNTRLMACLFPISLSLAQDDVKDSALQIWLEVWDDFHGIWIPVDAAKDIVDEPLRIIEYAQTRKSWGLYVLAFDTFGIKDVTQKYTQEWGSKVVKYRLKGENEREWTSLLSRYSRTWTDSKEKVEDEILKSSVVAEKMPTSLKGFLNHPVYALEKQLKKNEIIYPRGVEHSIGRFKNDVVYPRSSVRRALTSDAWIRQGRSIKEGEEPCKVSNGKKTSKDYSNLYGEWQTKPFVPPDIVDGKIPKNSFGNIEIFHPSMVPRETVHISGYPEALRVAKKLGLDYARAVTGFDFQRGKAIPRMEGIVIKEDHRELLLSAISEFVQKSLQEESKKREDRVLKSWAKLTKGILSLSNLRDRYLT